MSTHRPFDRTNRRRPAAKVRTVGQAAAITEPRAPHEMNARPLRRPYNAVATADMLRQAYGDTARAEALLRASFCERDHNREAARLWLDAYRELVVEDASNP